MKLFWMFCISLFLHSCIQIVNGNGYEYLSKEQHEKIVKFNPTITTFDKDKIYEVTADQLKNLLKKHDKSIVYIFTSGCSSDYCVPISKMEDFAQKNEYKLFLILSSYHRLELTTSQKISNQVFSINTDSYDSKNNSKCLKAFRKELKYYEVSMGQRYIGDVLVFNKDSLVEIRRSVD